MQSIVFAVVLTTALLAPSVALAQADEQAVRARVEEFLEKLGNRDVDAVRAMLSSKAAIIVVRQQQEGGFAPSYQTGEEFIAQLEKNANGPKFKEPLTNVHVTVDSASLAYLRADFTVVRDGKVLSSGVDQFTLVKETTGWRIAVAAYTSIPAH
jgi:ketosteroid isomerase-like protein